MYCQLYQIGEGCEQVYLVNLKPRGNVDISFALKGLQRSRRRSGALAFLPDSKGEVEKHRDGVRENIFRQHIAGMNNEKIALTHMPWSPWVTGLIQSFHDSEKIYMALEYIPGGTLRSVITKAHGHQDGGLDIATAQFYYANIVLALEFLEGCKLVHGDLKPDNILIGADGYLVLTDFGTAQLAEDRDSALGWKVFGTVYYMAPETFLECHYRAEDSPHSVDWWSSGIILFEMIAGRIVSFLNFMDMLFSPNFLGYVAVLRLEFLRN
jgi:serine/threonine protein kinase